MEIFPGKKCIGLELCGLTCYTDVNRNFSIPRRVQPDIVKRSYVFMYVVRQEINDTCAKSFYLTFTYKSTLSPSN